MNRTYQPSYGPADGPLFEAGKIHLAHSGMGSALFFANFRLEPDGTLFRGSKVVHLPPQELAALRLLLANCGQIVTPSQLQEALWGPVHVTADSVPKCLSSLRARLKPDDCIQTVYKRGYRLQARVETGEQGFTPALPRLAIPPFLATAGVPEQLGTHIAEETIFRLSSANPPAACILARDSVFTLAARGLTAQQLGEKLRADLVMAGTLRLLNGCTRLRVEMIRIADGVQIWVEDLLVKNDSEADLDAALASRLRFRLQAANSTPMRAPNAPWQGARESGSNREAVGAEDLPEAVSAIPADGEIRLVSTVGEPYGMVKITGPNLLAP